MIHPNEACSTQLKYLFDCRHEKANQLATSCNKLKNVTSIMNALFCSLTTTAACGWSGSSCLNSHRTLDLLFSSTLGNVVPLGLQVFTRHRCACAGHWLFLSGACSSSYPAFLASVDLFKGIFASSVPCMLQQTPLEQV